MLSLRNISGKLTLVAALYLGLACAQTPDSIAIKISEATGVKKAEVLSDAVAFLVRSDIKLAKQYVDDTYTLAQSNPDPIIEAYSYLTQGVYLIATDHYDSAIRLIKKGEQIATQYDNKKFLVRSGVALGRTYMYSGNPERALTYLYNTLKLLEASPNPEIEMKVRVNITWAYLELKRYRDAVNFGKRSLELIKPGLEYMIPYLCNNTAASYGALGILDSVKYLALKGIPISEKQNDYTLIANAYYILGNSYGDAGQYELAIEQFQKAKPYREKLGNQIFIVADLYTLSDLYYKKGDFKNGIKYGLAGLDIAKKYNLTLKFEGVYQSLALNYEAIGDYKSSSVYYNLLASAKDSIYQNATADALAEMQAKYESDKKEQQIQLLNSENDLKEATIERNYFLIGGLISVLLLVVLGFYIWQYRSQQQQKAVLQEQKVRLREAQVNAVIDSQEKERKRFASDLHDGMGQLISALQLNINSIRENRLPENRGNLFENSEQILSDIHSEIRNIAFNLMPPVLIKEGLISGLHELIRRINKTGVVEISLSSHKIQDRFNEVGEISIYRIMQEFLSNAVKHSEATRVTIDFTGHDNEVVITIEDDGIGYNLEKFQNSEGNGWRNINSRLNLIHAQIEFDIVEGRKNNTIIITVPEESVKISSLEKTEITLPEKS